jgi:hypothetical protein
MKYIGKNHGPVTPEPSSNWRHNNNGFPPCFRRQPVQTTGAIFINNFSPLDLNVKGVDYCQILLLRKS